VQRVAKQYFAATNRTVLDVIPAKSAAAQPAAPPAAKAPRAGSKKP
jgi:hypothetical protein